jgi:hypothetical protein
MVNFRLTHELDNAKRLPAEQYGFRRGRSTDVIMQVEAQEAFRKKQHLILVVSRLGESLRHMLIPYSSHPPQVKILRTYAVFCEKFHERSNFQRCHWQYKV